jgi:hypothetical protein
MYENSLIAQQHHSAWFFLFCINDRQRKSTVLQRILGKIYGTNFFLSRHIKVSIDPTCAQCYTTYLPILVLKHYSWKWIGEYDFCFEDNGIPRKLKLIRLGSPESKKRISRIKIVRGFARYIIIFLIEILHF